MARGWRELSVARTNKINKFNNLTTIYRGYTVDLPKRAEAGMRKNVADGLSARTRRLLDEHGHLLNAATTAKILGFDSTDALRTARIERRLPVAMFTIPGRRGWFASTEAVGEWLDNVLADASTESH